MHMQWFIVEAANRPGELARNLEAISQRRINLANIICLGLGDRGGAALYATDEAGLRQALDDAGVKFHEVSGLGVKIEDRPGQAAAAARSLADAGVNIELFAPVDMTDGHVTVAIGVDKLDAARKALGDRVTEVSMGMVGAHL
jgi:hypothetical protein